MKTRTYGICIALAIHGLYAQGVLASSPQSNGTVESTSAETGPIVIWARLRSNQTDPWAASFARANNTDGGASQAIGGPRRVHAIAGTWSPGDRAELFNEPRDNPGLAVYRWVSFSFDRAMGQQPRDLVRTIWSTGRFDLIGELRDQPVEWAQSSAINDPLYAFALSDPHKHQWAIDQARFRQAFGYSEGRALLGVIDQGVDPDHPDLVTNIRRHMTSSVDRFQTGLTYAIGYFPQTSVINSLAPNRPETTRVGHGLHVAGIVAAKSNNGIGISGACPNCGLSVLRFLYQSENPGALEATANMGVSVVSMSYSLTNRDNLLYEEQRIGIAQAYDQLVNLNFRDVSLVAAMGNNLTTTRADTAVVYPLPAALPFVIGVGATDFRKYRWDERLIAQAQLSMRHPMTNYSNIGVNRVANRCNSASKFECGSNYGIVVKTSAFSVPVAKDMPNMVFEPGQYGIDIVAPGAQILSTIDRVYSPFACFPASTLPTEIPAGSSRCHIAFSDPPQYPQNNEYSFAPASNEIGNSQVGAYAGVGYPLDPSYGNVPGNMPLPSTFVKYGVMTGTSMATPHVAAAAGLVRSVIPLLSSADTKALLKSTASIAELAIPAGNPPWTENDVGAGLVNAEEAVKRSLGKVNLVQQRNRLTPVFALTSSDPDIASVGAGTRAWLFTSSPQVAMAAIESRLYRVTDPAVGPGYFNTVGQQLPVSPENDFGIVQAIDYANSRSVGVGADFSGFYQYPLGYKMASALPTGSFLVFTTPYNTVTASADGLRPLFRMSMKCNQVRKHFYSSVNAEVAQWTAGPSNCGAGAGPGDQGYNLDGIEGYVFPSQIPKTEALHRRYSALHKAWALVIDSEINHPAFATYTQLDAILGYVYPFVSYSGNPAVASINDIDGDRLLDVVESTLGTNSLDSDSDNDGVPDGDEYSLRRIPTDPLIQ